MENPNEKKLMDKLKEKGISLTILWSCDLCNVRDIKVDTAEHDAKIRADVIDECISKLKVEFHTCLNCISYSTDECNNEDYFEDCCVTEKTISFEDIINFAEQLKERKNV